MEQYIDELIAAKVKLAETEDKLMAKSRYFKIHHDKLTENTCMLEKLKIENQLLLDSISQLIDEKNRLRVQLEEQNGTQKQISVEQVDTEEDEFRSPDQFLEIPNHDDTTEI